jgi:methylmalonyl-CoA mutase N-terminal domain/subunit
VAHVIDPLAGSYFVESQTNRLEEEAEAYFLEIEKRGGVVSCIEQGYIQREIHHSALEYQLAVERNQKRVVGVNIHVEELDAAPEIELLRIDSQVERDQHERLAELRKKRDSSKAQAELDAVRDACGDGGNLLERFVAAAHANCTLGEIAEVLRQEFGEYEEPRII